ncbi:hypothetical protein ACFWQC_19175 [Nocardioides sp. NPDC058538]|uniref:hypothetical protein n=1 Tax=Nocardioides sp. NPDC058538 TaxID=3346542 RepID=UPI00364EDC73
MKTTRIAAVMTTVALFATACGGSDDDDGGKADRDSSDGGSLSATDGAAYDECFDAACEVIVEKGTEIELDPDLGWEGSPGHGASGWSLLTVTDLSEGGVGLTLSAADASSTGGMATILPVGDSKAYYLNGMTAKILDASEEQAVLSLNWSGA